MTCNWDDFQVDDTQLDSAYCVSALAVSLWLTMRFRHHDNNGYHFNNWNGIVDIYAEHNFTSVNNFRYAVKCDRFMQGLRVLHCSPCGFRFTCILTKCKPYLIQRLPVNVFLCLQGNVIQCHLILLGCTKFGLAVINGALGVIVVVYLF